MVGFSGTVGSLFDALGFDTNLSWRGHESRSTFEADGVRVEQYGHDPEVGDQPVTIGTNTLLWVWGDVYGVSSSDGYISKEEEETTAEFLKRYLDNDWRDSLSDVNGSYVILVYEPDAAAFHIVPDKLSSRSIYYTVRDGTLLFSPRVQALYTGNDLSPEPNPEYLNVYFSSMRSMGVETPIAETFSCPPGSISTFDLDRGEMSTTSYWRPIHDPLDKPIEWFVEKFVASLERAVDERVPRDRHPAVLLSGGSDSRLVAAMLDRLGVDFRAYHTTTYESGYETVVTKTVADLLDVDLTLLRRDSDYFLNLLDDTLYLLNFDGTFEQAHLEPFMDEITAESGVLFSGHYGDTLCKGMQLPCRPSTNVNGISFYEMIDVTDADDLISYYIRESEFEQPYFFDGDESFYDIIARNVTDDGGGVSYHGLKFDDIDDHIMSLGAYPSSNMSDAYFKRTLRENLPLRTPFMDDRILDLVLKMPKEMLFEYNIIDRAITEIDQSLATVASASTDIPPVVADKYQLNVDYSELNLPEPPEDWQSHGPWGYDGYLTGEQRDELMSKSIEQREEVIESFEYIDESLVFKYHDACANGPPFGHLRRAHTRSFLSFIFAPIATQMCEG